jgi:hypothetical protein
VRVKLIRICPRAGERPAAGGADGGWFDISQVIVDTTQMIFGGAGIVAHPSRFTALGRA